ncbi:MAG: lysylphosphatidylglycerol synthase domain-containing protein [Planctomycetota bacterium]|nr:lysylphosphatidylglycerol synthase domain-containing protein [Planctomycetota bacterium]
MSDSPDHPPAAPSPVSRPRGVKILIQIVGFLGGLALLGWCVTLAFNPSNREQLEKIRDLAPSRVALLAALSLATILLDGLIFWFTLRPVRRLAPVDVVATNAVATFLNYLPFKLGLISRFVIHNRRDGVPVLTIFAWMAALAMGILSTYAPVVLVSLARPNVDGLWAAMVALALALSFVLVWQSSRLFAGELGLRRLDALAGAIRLPILRRFFASAMFRHLHAGFAMLADARCLAAVFALRILDLGLQAWRYHAAFDALGQPIAAEKSVLIAAGYMMIGVVSPFGMAGTREGGITWLITRFGLEGVTASGVAVVVLLVGAFAAVSTIALAALGLAWLRPDRLLRSRSR